MQKKLSDDMVPRLVALYKSDHVARKIFDWLADRLNDSSETAIERAAQKAVASYTETFKVFRVFEDIGIGRIIEGRKGYKTPFAWAFSVKSIGAAARQERTGSPILSRPREEKTRRKRLKLKRMSLPSGPSRIDCSCGPTLS